MKTNGIISVHAKWLDHRACNERQQTLLHGHVYCSGSQLQNTSLLYTLEESIVYRQYADAS